MATERTKIGVRALNDSFVELKPHYCGGKKSAFQLLGDNLTDIFIVFFSHPLLISSIEIYIIYTDSLQLMIRKDEGPNVTYFCLEFHSVVMRHWCRVTRNSDDLPV